MDLFSESHTSCEADIYQPLLAFIRDKKLGCNSPPYIPKWELMPVHKLCKLALLWQEAGFEKEAGRLAHWLSKLRPFPLLWCQESEYDDEETQKLFSHLSKIPPIFSGEEPDFNVKIIETPQISAALTLDGNSTSLGMIRAGDVQIRAFGPQNSTLMFGIQGKGQDGWTRTAAFPEVWLEMKAATNEGALKLDFRFIGINPETPLSLAFYVKAQSCQISQDVLRPKSLRRFHGEVQSITFENKLKIEAGQPHKVQVIPLAGEGCYWDSEFLLSFELYPCVTQASFNITQIF